MWENIYHKWYFSCQTIWMIACWSFLIRSPRAIEIIHLRAASLQYFLHMAKYHFHTDLLSLMLLGCDAKEGWIKFSVHVAYNRDHKPTSPEESISCTAIIIPQLITMKMSWQFLANFIYWNHLRDILSVGSWNNPICCLFSRLERPRELCE